MTIFARLKPGLLENGPRRYGVQFDIVAVATGQVIAADIVAWTDEGGASGLLAAVLDRESEWLKEHYGMGSAAAFEALRANWTDAEYQAKLGL